jgi:hypothetical protein
LSGDQEAAGEDECGVEARGGADPGVAHWNPPSLTPFSYPGK